MFKAIYAVGLAVLIALLTACGGQQSPNGAHLNVQLTASNSSVVVGENVQFTANVTTNGRPVTLSWDFGDGNTIADGGSAVSHGYATPGEYTASVTVHADDGSAAKGTTVVVVSATSDTGPRPEFHGEGHLGEWVWLVMGATGSEASGMTEFTQFVGDLTPTTREAIVGTWDVCTYSCTRMGTSVMMEMELEAFGWEHTLVFYNSVGDVRLLAADFEATTLDDGTPAYFGIGDYYGAAVRVGIARLDAASLSSGPTVESAATRSDQEGVLDALRGLLR